MNCTKSHSKNVAEWNLNLNPSDVRAHALASLSRQLLNKYLLNGVVNLLVPLTRRTVHTQSHTLQLSLALSIPAQPRAMQPNLRRPPSNPSHASLLPLPGCLSPVAVLRNLLREEPSSLPNRARAQPAMATVYGLCSFSYWASRKSPALLMLPPRLYEKEDWELCSGGHCHHRERARIT